ncbi:uncharacterized protein WM294_011191 [Sarcoramphus papa]
MRFKHGKVHLVPYPYICTVYLELNSFQQNVSCELEPSVFTIGVKQSLDLKRIPPKKRSVSLVQHPLPWAVTKWVSGDLWNLTLNKEQQPVRLRVQCSYCSKRTKW